ncbi:biogenesis of lysosome-related organelles complex 1 subunit 2-like [Macrotis lagotis]|uniref:biogenesis of lysosome-related organelles complex 1 subunit 2-like n=1 Tax=Macrotis lagotis TaxID=92651 RepID=UPI003D6937DC
MTCPRSHLDIHSEDHKLLENMNKLSSFQYLEIKDITVNITRNPKDFKLKYTAVWSYLHQITLIEGQVAALEKIPYKLDAPSKKLEAKYGKLGKQLKSSLTQGLY